MIDESRIMNLQQTYNRQLFQTKKIKPQIKGVLENRTSKQLKETPPPLSLLKNKIKIEVSIFFPKYSGKQIYKSYSFLQNYGKMGDVISTRKHIRCKFVAHIFRQDFLVRVGWRDEEMRNRNLEMNSFEPETQQVNSRSHSCVIRHSQQCFTPFLQILPSNILKFGVPHLLDKIDFPLLSNKLTKK